MEYDCQAVPMDKLAVGPKGVEEPLCNSCANPDCSNPIRSKTVNVLGVPKPWRLWVVGNMVRQVVQCKGYISGAAP